MSPSFRRRALHHRSWHWLIVLASLVGAFYLGLHASRRWMVLLLAAMAGVSLLVRPVLGLLALVIAALALPIQFSTGTAVALNPATLLVPALLVLWLVTRLVRDRMHVFPSPVHAPLLAFLLTAALSLLIGSVTWDPAVPRVSLATQIGQWAIFAFSAVAFWLAANLIGDQIWLRRLTFTFLSLGTSASPRLLTLSAASDGRAIVSEESVILAPGTDPAVTERVLAADAAAPATPSKQQRQGRQRESTQRRRGAPNQ